MYTLIQAAEATGRHKSTILRALQANKIPSEKDVHGSYQIEPDALHAVYPAVRTDSAPIADAPESTSAPLRDDATIAHQQTQLDAIAALEAVSEQKSEQVTDLRATVTDLQKRLDQAESDRRQLEADRRQADENATRQIDQLTAVMALKEKTLQEQVRALEHVPEQPLPEPKRQGLFASLFA